MNDQRIIDTYIRSLLGDYSSLERLAGDASAREYYRVHTAAGTRILCVDPALRGVPLESFPYYIVYSLFRDRGIPVPVVFHFNNREGLLLIEDMGDLLLESELGVLSPGERTSVYRRLIDILILIQGTERDPGLMPFRLAFDVEKLMFEFNFFIEHALGKYFRPALSDACIEELRREFFSIATFLDRPDHFVLNHRDYHSRNVMMKNGLPFIIDFQDARLGLPHYDLVSLLRDSYIRLDDDLFDNLRKYYYHEARGAGIHGMTMDEFEYFFDLMAFQRNVKALGTFGYQVKVLGKTYFEKYIVPTVEYLDEYIRRRDELKKAGEILRVCFAADR
jgi:aminoglycoside/choline kinase family phosphotransferase